MNLGPFAKPAIFAIGKVCANCVACQGSEFVASRRFQDDPPLMLTCTSCGAEYPTATLMEQVARKVMARADLALKLNPRPGR